MSVDVEGLMYAHAKELGISTWTAVAAQAPTLLVSRANACQCRGRRHARQA